MAIRPPRRAKRIDPKESIMKDGVDESMAVALFETEKKEMKKLKRQFVKELKALIEGEIQRERMKR